jgi:hypothetical protein
VKLSEADIHYVEDGRQSETALIVARGVRRFLAGLGYSSLPELSLASGRRADLVALGDQGEVLIIEIKSSIADFRVDQKWPDYRLHCDRFFFAIPQHVPAEIMPQDAGLIVADAYGAYLMRDAPEHRLPAPTRKAMTLRYARAAAERLHRLFDPDAMSGL